MNYFIAHRWEEAEAVLGTSPTNIPENDFYFDNKAGFLLKGVSPQSVDI